MQWARTLALNMLTGCERHNSPDWEPGVSTAPHLCAPGHRQDKSWLQSQLWPWLSHLPSLICSVRKHPEPAPCGECKM